jgi:hypothetical protein
MMNQSIESTRRGVILHFFFFFLFLLVRRFAVALRFPLGVHEPQNTTAFLLVIGAKEL